MTKRKKYLEYNEDKKDLPYKHQVILLCKETCTVDILLNKVIITLCLFSKLVVHESAAWRAAW